MDELKKLHERIVGSLPPSYQDYNAFEEKFKTFTEEKQRYYFATNGLHNEYKSYLKKKDNPKYTSGSEKSTTQSSGNSQGGEQTQSPQNSDARKKFDEWLTTQPTREIPVSKPTPPTPPTPEENALQVEQLAAMGTTGPESTLAPEAEAESTLAPEAESNQPFLPDAPTERADATSQYRPGIKEISTAYGRKEGQSLKAVAGDTQSLYEEPVEQRVDELPSVNEFVSADASSEAFDAAKDNAYKIASKRHSERRAQYKELSDEDEGRYGLGVVDAAMSLYNNDQSISDVWAAVKPFNEVDAKYQRYNKKHEDQLKLSISALEQKAKDVKSKMDAESNPVKKNKLIEEYNALISEAQKTFEDYKVKKEQGFKDNPFYEDWARAKTSSDNAYKQYDAALTAEIDRLEDYALANKPHEKSIRDAQKKLNAAKSAFLDVNAILEISPDAKNATGETPIEKLENHVFALMELRKQLQSEYDRAGQIFGQKELDRMINSIGVGMFRSAEFQGIPSTVYRLGVEISELDQKLGILVPAVAINRVKLREESASQKLVKGLTFVGNPLETMLPAGDRSAWMSETEEAETVLDAIQKAGVGGNVTNPMMNAIELSFDQTFLEKAGTTIGTSMDMMPWFMVGRVVTTGLKAATVAKTLDRFDNAAKAALGSSKAGKATYAIGKGFANAIDEGISYALAGELAEGLTENNVTAADEGTFMSGFFGSTFSDVQKTALNLTPGGKKLKQAYALMMGSVFGASAKQAHEILYRGIRVNAQGVAEIGEEFGNEFGSAMNDAGGSFGEAWRIFKEGFTPTPAELEKDPDLTIWDKAAEFAALTYISGAIFGLGSVFGDAMSKDFEKWYSKLTDTQKEKFDKAKEEVDKGLLVVNTAMEQIIVDAASPDGPQDGVDVPDVDLPQDGADIPDAQDGADVPDVDLPQDGVDVPGVEPQSESNSTLEAKKAEIEAEIEKLEKDKQEDLDKNIPFTMLEDGKHFLRLKGGVDTGMDEIVAKYDAEIAKKQAELKTLETEPNTQSTTDTESEANTQSTTDTQSEANKPDANESIEPIRELGTGAKVYFETPAYRVNEQFDYEETGNVDPYRVNIKAKGDTDGVPVHAETFQSVEEAVAFAKELDRMYPDGVPEALDIPKAMKLIRDGGHKGKPESIKPVDETLEAKKARKKAKKAEIEKLKKEKPTLEATYGYEDIDMAQTPEEVAEIYDQEVMSQENVDYKESLMAHYLGKNVNESSFNNNNDSNNTTGSIAKTYFAKKGEGRSLDEIAQEINNEHFDGNEVITPNDLGDHMVNHPGGFNPEAPSGNKKLRAAAEKYAALTGKGINRKIAKNISKKAKEIRDRVDGDKITPDQEKLLEQIYESEGGHIDYLFEEFDAISSWLQMTLSPELYEQFEQQFTSPERQKDFRKGYERISQADANNRAAIERTERENQNEVAVQELQELLGVELSQNEGFLNKKQAEELQKEIELNYDTTPKFGQDSNDIRKSLYNYDNPYAQKNVNGVDLRIAQGLIEGVPYSGNRRSTWLLYADGKIVGKFYAIDDIKRAVKHIEDNLLPANRIEQKATPEPEVKPKEGAKPKSRVRKEHDRVRKEHIDELRKALDDALGDIDITINSGFNPDQAIKVAKAIAKFLELGYYKLSDIVAQMVDHYGKEITEKLLNLVKASYKFARQMASQEQKGFMDSDAAVDAFVIESILDEEVVEEEHQTTTTKLRLFVNEIKGAIKAKTSLNYRAMRQMAKDTGFIDDTTNLPDKQIQEAAEIAIIEMAQEISDGQGTDAEKIAAIQDLYDSQPSFTMKTSDRDMLGQFSTPVTISYSVGAFLNSHNIKVGYEPSAGNGMLLINVAQRGFFVVNEIDAQRSFNLHAANYAKVYNYDAETINQTSGVDAVVMNPPFGSIPQKRVGFYQGIIRGVKTSLPIVFERKEHVHAQKALESLNQNGRAVIITGGHLSHKDSGHLESENGFFTWLDANFNVIDIISINQNMYSKQGTTTPVKMILIAGRKPSGEVPALPRNYFKDSPVVNTAEELLNRVIEANEQAILRQKGIQGPGISLPPQLGTTPGGLKQDNPNGDQGSTPGPKGNEQTPPTEEVKGDGKRLDTDEGGPNDSDRSDVDQPNGDQQSEPSGVDNNEQPRDEIVDPPSTRNDRGDELEADVVEINKRRVSILSGSGELHAASQRQIDTAVLKNRYIPKSKNPNVLDLVTPTNMAKETYEILSSFEDIDLFVASRMGITKEQLFKALSAEQIDAVAMAMYQIEMGKSLTIGDQTGVGKGRQAAAILVYAINMGMKPVFVTARARLFSDIWRDIKAIGFSHLKPFILNDDTEANIKEEKGVDLSGEPKIVTTFSSRMGGKKAKSDMVKSGDIKDHDFVVATYSQFNSEKRPTKRDFLLNFLQGSIIVMDEAHMAAGRFDPDTQVGSNTLLFFTSILNRVRGAVFLSATSTKTMDNMYLYANKNELGSVEYRAGDQVKVGVSAIQQSIEKGGIPVQEMIARELSKSGQIIRRERDMSQPLGKTKFYIDFIEARSSGIDPIAKFDESSRVFNMIDVFSKMFNSFVKQGNATGQWGTEEVSGVPSPVKAGYTTFISRMYNMNQQLTLAVKVDAVVDKAIKHLAEGRKPIIAVDLTNESFLQDLESDGEGNFEKPNFSHVLLRALSSATFIRIGRGKSAIKVKVPQSEWPPELLSAYHDVMNQINKMSKDLPLSPIDYIIQKIEDAGYRIGEITGRGKVVDRGGNIVPRRKIGSVETVHRFNNANDTYGYHALIVNRSAAEGLSAHASADFLNRQQRILIIAQAQADINNEIQLWGRVDRTGQVVRGAVEYMYSPIPAEQRLFMMLRAKVKKLLANTAADQSSDVQGVDMLNKYGDVIAKEYWLNADVPDSLYNLMDKNPETMNDILKKLPLLLVSEQESVFNTLTSMYLDRIKYLDDNKINDLESSVLDIKAKLIDSRVVYKGDNSGNPFMSSVIAKLVEYESPNTPMSASEVEAKMSEMTMDIMSLDQAYTEYKAKKIEATKQARVERAEQTIREKIEEEIEIGNLQPSQYDTELESRLDKKTSEIQSNYEEQLANNKKSKVGHFLRAIAPGSLVTIDSSMAVLVGYEVGGKQNDDGVLPVIPSQTYAVFAVATSSGASRQKIPLSMIDGNGIGFVEERGDKLVFAKSDWTDYLNRAGEQRVPGVFQPKAWDALIQNIDKITTNVILTGNLVQAANVSSGWFVTYTKEDGTTEAGMIALFADEISDIDQDGGMSVREMASEATALSRDGVKQSYFSDRYNVVVNGKNSIIITTHKSRRRGGSIYMNRNIVSITGSFTQRGESMVVEVNTKQFERLTEHLPPTYFSKQQQSEAKPNPPKYMIGVSDYTFRAETQDTGYDAKGFAKRLRKLKIKGFFSAIDFGLTTGIYNAALEMLARQLEAGTKLGKAIAKTINWIDSKMEGKQWKRAEFAKHVSGEMSQQYASSIAQHPSEKTAAEQSTEVLYRMPGRYKGIVGLDYTSKDANYIARALDILSTTKWKMDIIPGKTTMEEVVELLADYIDEVRRGCSDLETTTQSGYLIKSIPPNFFDNRIAQSKAEFNQAEVEKWEYMKNNEEEFLLLQQNAQFEDINTSIRYITSPDNEYGIGFQVFAIHGTVSNSAKDVNSFSINPIVASKLYNDLNNIQYNFYDRHEKAMSSLEGVEMEEVQDVITKETKEGYWLLFEKNENATSDSEDVKLLNKTAATSNNKSGGWCTGGSFETTVNHISGGDFYIFISKDNMKAQIALRFLDNTLAEPPRGLGAGQSVLPKHYDILEEMISDLSSGPKGSGLTKAYNQIKTQRKVKGILSGQLTMTEREAIEFQGESTGSFGVDTYLEQAKEKVMSIIPIFKEGESIGKFVRFQDKIDDTTEAIKVIKTTDYLFKDELITNESLDGYALDERFSGKAVIIMETKVRGRTQAVFIENAKNVEIHTNIGNLFVKNSEVTLNYTGNSVAKIGLENAIVKTEHGGGGLIVMQKKSSYIAPKAQHRDEFRSDGSGNRIYARIGYYESSQTDIKSNKDIIYNHSVKNHDKLDGIMLKSASWLNTEAKNTFINQGFLPKEILGTNLRDTFENLEKNGFFSDGTEYKVIGYGYGLEDDVEMRRENRELIALNSSSGTMYEVVFLTHSYESFGDDLRYAVRVDRLRKELGIPEVGPLGHISYGSTNSSLPTPASFRAPLDQLAEHHISPTPPDAFFSEKESQPKLKFMANPKTEKNKALDSFAKLIGSKFPNVKIKIMTGAELVALVKSLDPSLKDMDIDHRTIQGFKHNGVIYLNSDSASAETVIHEFAHIWVEILKEQNPKAYWDAINGIRGTKWHKAVQNNPMYNYEGTPEQVEEQELDEALVTAIGEKGNQMLSRNATPQWLQNVIDWINKMYKKVFGIKKANPTIEDFIKKAAEDVLYGSTKYGTGAMEGKGNFIGERSVLHIFEKISLEKAKILDALAITVNPNYHRESSVDATRMSVDIYDATGWFRGLDGKWRMLQPPHSISKTALSQAIQAVRDGLSISFRIEEVIPDSPLLDRYKDLVTHVTFAPAIYVGSERLGGTFSKGAVTVYLEKAPKTISMADLANVRHVANTCFAHELQHAIQRKEGFDTGTNPVDAGPQLATSEGFSFDAVKEYADAYAYHKDVLTTSPVVQEVYHQRRMDGQRTTIEDIVDELASQRASEDVQNMQMMHEAKFKEALKDPYRHKAGEVEARWADLVQSVYLYDKSGFTGTKLFELLDTRRERSWIGNPVSVSIKMMATMPKRYEARQLEEYADIDYMINAIESKGLDYKTVPHEGVAAIAEDLMSDMVATGDMLGEISKLSDVISKRTNQEYRDNPHLSTLDAIITHKVLDWLYNAGEIEQWTKWSDDFSTDGRHRGRFISAMQQSSTKEAIMNMIRRESGEREFDIEGFTGSKVGEEVRKIMDLLSLSDAEFDTLFENIKTLLSQTVDYANLLMDQEADSEVKDAAIKDLIQEVAEMKLTKEQIEARLEELLAQVEDLTQQLSDANADRIALQNQVDELNDTIERLRARLNDGNYQAEPGTTRDRIKEARDQINLGKDQIRDAINRARGTLSTTFTTLILDPVFLSGVRNLVMGYISLGVFKTRALASEISKALTSSGVATTPSQVMQNWHNITTPQIANAQTRASKIAFVKALARRAKANLKTNPAKQYKIKDPIDACLSILLPKLDEIIPPREKNQHPDETIDRLIEAIENAHFNDDIWTDAADLAKDHIRDAVNNGQISAAEGAAMIANIEDSVSAFMKLPFPASLARKAIKEEMHTFDIKLRDIIRLHLSRREGIGRTLAETIVTKTGVDPRVAVLIEEGILAEYIKMVEESRKAALYSMYGLDKNGNPKIKGADVIPNRILDLLRMGVLSDAAVRDLFIKEYGLNAMTSGDMAQIEKMLRMIDLAQGSELRNRYTKSLLDYISDRSKWTPHKFFQTIHTLAVRGMLTALFSTISVNITIGSMAAFVAAAAPKVIANPVATLAFLKKGNQSLGAMGLQTFLDIMVNGFSDFDNLDSRFNEQPSALVHGSHVDYYMNNFFQRLIDGFGQVKDGQVVRGIKTISATTLLQAFRLANFAKAFDAIITLKSAEWLTFLEQYNTEMNGLGIKGRLNPSDITSIIKKVSDSMGYHGSAVYPVIVQEVDAEIAERKRLGLEVPIGYRNRRILERMHEYRRTGSSMMDYDAMMDRSVEMSKWFMLMNHPTGGAGMAYTWMTKMTSLKRSTHYDRDGYLHKKNTILDVLSKTANLPFFTMTLFARVAINFVQRANEATAPLLLGIPMIGIASDAKQRHKIGTIMGMSAIFMTLSMLLLNEMFEVEDDDEENVRIKPKPNPSFKVTGGAGGKYWMYEQMSLDPKSPYIPYTLQHRQQDGTYRNLMEMRLNPGMFNVATILGDAYETMSASPDTAHTVKSALKDVPEFIFNGHSNVSMNTPIRAAQGLHKDILIDGWSYGFLNWVYKTSAGTVKAVIVPSISREIQREMAVGEDKRKPLNFREKFVQDMYFLDGMIQELDYDHFGYNIKTQSKAKTALSKITMGAYESPYDEDRLNQPAHVWQRKMHAKGYEVTIDKYWPSKINKSIFLAVESGEMSDEDTKALQSLTREDKHEIGRIYAEKLRETILSHDIVGGWEVGREEFGSVLEKMEKDAKKHAQMEFLSRKTSEK